MVSPRIAVEARGMVMDGWAVCYGMYLKYMRYGHVYILRVHILLISVMSLLRVCYVACSAPFAQICCIIFYSCYDCSLALCQFKCPSSSARVWFVPDRGFLTFWVSGSVWLDRW